MQSKADHKLQFEAQLNGEWIVAEADVWTDHEGIYKQEITGVFIDGTDIIRIINPEYIDQLDAMIPEMLRNELEEARFDFNPERDAHRLGD
jgi:hypothetical protein